MALNRVGIVCALAGEARHLAPATHRHPPLETLADGTLLAVTGMGLSAAAAGSRALVEAGAGALASWGLAGGLDPQFPPGTICLPTEVAGLDGAGVATDAGWRTRVSAAVTHYRPVVHGKLLTSARAIGSVAEKASLFQRTGAAAVDMESLAVAQCAASHTLRFIAVRVIVDAAFDALPQAVTAAADVNGHLQMWRLIAALARAPANLGPLLRLANRYRLANQSLAAVARTGALAPLAFRDCGR